MRSEIAQTSRLALHRRFLQKWRRDDDGATESSRLKQLTKDCHGREVRVGSRVRLLKVAEFLRRDLPPNEWTRLQSMVGQVFEVTEIDEYGGAWIEKWFDDPEDGRASESYSLAADEMELVTN